MTKRMELVFFIAKPEAALGVCSSHDLPGDMAGDPILADGPGALLGLAECMAYAPRGTFRQLRDTTCRSYPVWSLSAALCSRLEEMDDAGIDALAERWHPHPETDAFERASCLAALRDALADRGRDEALFALLEERAL
jgi:hypothetical protein